MAINIETLLTAITSRNATKDAGSNAAGDSATLDSLISEIDNNYDIYVTVDSSIDLPLSDVTNHGALAYTTISDAYYVSNATSGQWDSLELQLPGGIVASKFDLLANGKNFGYLHGGSGGVQTTEKMAFSSGTISTVSPGWTRSSEAGTGFSSETNAYIAGGATPAPLFYSQNIINMSFSSETVTTSPQTFTQGLHVTPVSNPNPGTVGIYKACGTNAKAYSVGYIFRGDNAYSPNGFSTTSKYNTSNDILSQAIVVLSGGNGYNGGAANDGVNAYIASSALPDTVAPHQQTNLLAMASDTELSGSITVGTPTADGAVENEQMLNSSTNIYYSGVENSAPSPSAYTTEIFKYSFSVGSPVTLSIIGDLTEKKARGSAHSTINDGYWIRGNAPNPLGPFTVGTVDRFPFATEVGAVEIATYTNGQNRSVGTNLQY